jgi:ATP-binding cassette subfamily B protein
MNNTEKEIQTAIDNITRDKTVIAIAHRLSTPENMTRMIILNEDRIVGDERRMPRNEEREKI